MVPRGYLGKKTMIITNFEIVLQKSLTLAFMKSILQVLQNLDSVLIKKRDIVKCCVWNSLGGDPNFLYSIHETDTANHLW